jgi:hypothetical protein
MGMALVPTEDEENYNWFFNTLKKNNILKDEVIGQNELVVITDRAKGLLNAVKSELPQAHHRYCSLHLLGNVPPPAFSTDQRILYWRIVKSNSLQEFNANMLELKDSHYKAYEYLSNIDYSLWVDFKQPLSSCGLYSDNLAERAVNILGNDVNDGRKLCPMQMVDLICVELCSTLTSFGIETNR